MSSIKKKVERESLSDTESDPQEDSIEQDLSKKFIGQEREVFNYLQTIDSFSLSVDSEIVN